MSGDALLALFHEELGAHVRAMRGVLDTPGLPPPDLCEQARRAAHAVWGSAKLVGLEAVAGLAGALRDACSGQLAEAKLRAVREAVECLGQMAEAASLPEWLVAHQAELETRAAAFAGPPAGNKPAPTEPEQARDPALLKLFLSELENQTQALGDGLLALERQPGSGEVLDTLMRAAHSAKGGARVIGLAPVVRLAHCLEDCFVAAQRGEITLTAGQIDVLLRGVDRLAQFGEALADGADSRLRAQEAELPALLDSLAAVRQGREALVTEPVEVAAPPCPSTSSGNGLPFPATEPVEVAAPPCPSTSSGSGLPFPATEPVEVAAPYPSTSSGSGLPRPSASAGSSSPEEAEQDRAVRVTAGKIERLMGLAGEVVVNTRWLAPFAESLLALKRKHADLAHVLERLQERLHREEAEPAILKLLAQAREQNHECNSALAERLNQLDIFTNTFATHSDRLYQAVIGVRMRPFADGARGFPRMVRDLARQLGKKVAFEILGKSTEVDQDILEKLDAPLTHLLRNALDHGLEPPAERLAAGKPETGTLCLEAGHRAGMLSITVSDDGRGIDLERLRARVLEKNLASPELLDKLDQQEWLDFLFLPGFSTASQVTELSGRGVGLDVVRNMAQEVGGQARASVTPGQGSQFYLELPLTLSVIRTFLVEIGQESYAFSLARIERCLTLAREDIETVEDRQYFRLGQRNIALIDLHEVLELAAPPRFRHHLNVVVVSDRHDTYGLAVDRFLGEYDLVVRPLDPRLGRVPDISAVAVMLDGSPVLILDVEDLIHSINKLLSNRRLRKLAGEQAEAAPDNPRKRILVVDDSLTVREMERKLLEYRGYAVETAVDGLEGWSALRSMPFDLMVTDIDMPRMNGMELIQRLRHHEELRSLPVIIVSYKDSPQHRLQGMEAGANYYLTKSSFEDDSFIQAVEDLIGSAESVG